MSIQMYDDLAHFTCMGEVNPEDFNCNGGYLCTGELRKLLGLEQLTQNSKECCILFGLCFSRFNALGSENLFSMVKRQISTIRISAQRWTGNSLCMYTGNKESAEYTRLRRDIYSFLFFLKSELQKLQLVPDSLGDRDEIFEVFQMLKSLSFHLKGLLLYLGRLSDVPEHIISSGISSCDGRTQPATYHYYHLVLDVWWSALVAFYTLDRLNWPSDVSRNVVLCFDDPLGQDTPTSQCAFLLLWDLITLASRRFVKLPLQDYFKVSPFHCTCIREMWTSIINLLDSRSNWNGEKDFWSHLHVIFKMILESRVEENPLEIMPTITVMRLIPVGFACSSPARFCLWLVDHVAPLYQYNVRGNFVSESRVRSNYDQLQGLLKQIMADQTVKKNEPELRFLLQSFLKLSKIWEPSIELLLPLTEFFLKHLDYDFHQPIYGLDNHCILNKSGQSWSQQICERIDSGSTWKSSDSSFQLYLQLLSNQLRSLDPIKQSTAFKQIKGRVFSKIMAKTMQNLTETGLHNFLSLLLTLSCLTDMQDMREKVCLVANMLKESSVSKVAITWHSLFALMLSMQDKKRDLAAVAQKTALLFSSVCQLITRPSCQDNIQRHNQVSLLLIYFEGVKDVIENSPNFALSEHLLFNESFGILFPHCNASELSAALSCIECVVTQMRNFCQNDQSLGALFLREPQILEHYKSIFQILNNNVLPFVISHATTGTPPPQIADIAVGLSLLSLNRMYGSASSRFSSLYQQFAVNAKVHPSVSCRYLTHLLASDEAHLALDGEQQMLTVRVWLRCVVSTSPPSDQVDELTRLVLGLGVVLERLPSLATLLPVRGTYDSTVIQFFRCLGNGLNDSMPPQEKTRLRQTVAELLKDFVPAATETLKNNPSVEVANHVFKLSGHLVLHASSALYSKGKPDCLLPLILDSTILPLTLIRDKPTPPAVFSASKQHLGLFLEGLTQLSYRLDAYVGRKVKDIVCHYLPRFSNRTGTSSQITHPLLLVLTEQVDKDLMMYCVEVIRDSFIQKKGSPHFAQAIDFLMEIFNRAAGDEKMNVASLLLPSILDHLLQCVDSSVAQSSREALEQILSVTATDKSPLLRALESFLETHLPWSSNRVFKLLEYVASISPALTTALLPYLTRAVERVEEKRGVGRDQLLRQGIINVAGKLQRKTL